MIARVSNEITHPPHPVVLPAAPGWPIHPAMVTVTNEIASFRITRSLGIVRGTVVRPSTALAEANALVNGSEEYFHRLSVARDKARFQAHLLMLEAAARVGANAVVGVRYESIEVANNLVEMLAYGTAAWAEYIDGASVIHVTPIESPHPSSEIATRGSDELTKT
ncbi:MAG: heavy metal-binding domain-containing protein [Polyangiales bacterium]